MPDQEQLELLFERWEESFEQGNPSNPQDLCQSTEHLLPQLLQRIEAFQAMERLRQRVSAKQKASISSAETGSFEGNKLASTADSTPRSQASSKIDLSFLDAERGSGELGWLGEDYCAWGVLGQGGMGLVLEVENVRLSRREALKLIRPDRVNEQSRQRFVREAQALASITHQGVVPIYHVGEMEGLPFLTMPLLRGESLRERLKRRGALAVTEVMRWGEQMALGLATAHTKDLVHRDLKPANVFLARQKSSEGSVQFDSFRFRTDQPMDCGVAFRRPLQSFTRRSRWRTARLCKRCAERCPRPPRNLSGASRARRRVIPSSRPPPRSART